MKRTCFLVNGHTCCLFLFENFSSLVLILGLIKERFSRGIWGTLLAHLGAGQSKKIEVSLCSRVDLPWSWSRSSPPYSTKVLHGLGRHHRCVCGSGVIKIVSWPKYFSKKGMDKVEHLSLFLLLIGRGYYYFVRGSTNVWLNSCLTGLD